MDRLTVLLDLARRLNEAATQGNWEELARTDSWLAATLPPLAAQGQWSKAESAAFDGLRQAHQAASQCCANELSVVAGRLLELSAGRDGWLAYAQNGDPEET